MYVEDEHGDNYAGGIRLRVGVHPETRMPQIVGTATLAIGHLSCLANDPIEVRRETALQLLEDIASFIAYSGIPTTLPYPDQDLRLLLDGRRVHVFFPRPRENDSYSVEMEPAETFEGCEILKIDRLGFLANFEPAVPSDAAFNYKLLDILPGSAEREVAPASRGKKTRVPPGGKRKKTASS